MRQLRTDSGGFITTAMNLKVLYKKEFLHQLNPTPWSASINVSLKIYSRTPLSITSIHNTNCIPAKVIKNLQGNRMFSGNLHWKNYVQADTAKKIKNTCSMVISHCIINNFWRFFRKRMIFVPVLHTKKLL